MHFFSFLPLFISFFATCLFATCYLPALRYRLLTFLQYYFDFHLAQILEKIDNALAYETSNHQFRQYFIEICLVWDIVLMKFLTNDFDDPIASKNNSISQAE